MGDKFGGLQPLMLGLVLTLVFIGFLAGIVSPAVDSTDDIRANPCEAASCFYYGENNTCVDNSTTIVACTSTVTNYAGSTFFTRAGAVWAVMFAGILLAIVAFYTTKRR